LKIGRIFSIVFKLQGGYSLSFWLSSELRSIKIW
jgi:hypothetical protein